MARRQRHDKGKNKGKKKAPRIDALQRQEINSTLATAVALHQQGSFEQAESLYRVILKVDPNHSDAMHLLGVLAHQVGRNDMACELIGHAIELNPHEPQYRYSLGAAAQAFGDLPTAIKAYRAAVRMQPDHLQALQNLGVALQDSNERDAAVAAYEKALAIEPHSPLTLLNLGTLLLNSANASEALTRFSAVLEINPASSEAHWKRSHALLAAGRFGDGWREYEWRFFSETFLRDNPPRVRPFPKWDGSPLAGKRLLVVAEQGVGDEVMFASCLPDVAAQAAGCAIECDPRLVDLFQRSFPGVEVLPATTGCAQYSLTQPFDVRASAGSLPRFLRSAATDFGTGTSFLRPDPARQSHWRDTLGSLGTRPNIGISWRAGKGARARRERSIALNEWQPLFESVQANFINLQYGDHSEEIAAFPADLHCFDGVDPLTDLDDFCALVSVLDLVISVDNSTVHFAGALGTPVWILLPYGAEWRWLESDRSTSVWYASARLFRRGDAPTNGWRELLGEVTDALGAHGFGNTRRDPEPRAPDTEIVPRVAPQSRLKPRALVLNDTSNWYDWGCTCSMLGVHDALRRAGCVVESVPAHQVMTLSGAPASAGDLDDEAIFTRFVDSHRELIGLIEECDTVYVNGVGGLGDVSAPALTLLYLAHVSKSRFGKRVHAINHSCVPDDSTSGGGQALSGLYAKVYGQLDHVAVREPRSARRLTEMGIVATPAFDCLPLFLERHYPTSERSAGDNVVIAGAEGWSDAKLEALSAFVAQMHGRGARVQFLFGANAYPSLADLRALELLHRSVGACLDPVAAMSEAEWLRCIRDAGLVVSSGLHPSIAAAFLDAPLLPVDDATPAFDGLMELLALSARVPIAAPDLAGVLCEQAHALMSSPDTGRIDDAKKAELRSLCLENFGQRA